jgi:hypothetical protein
MTSVKSICLIILLTISQLIDAQSPVKNWEKWNHLIGEWVGEGGGQTGQNEGRFSFLTDLDGNILVRKNHTVFPETATTKKMVHDDLLIIYPVDQGDQQEAIYFDNEGNTIKYKVSFSENSVVLTSDLSAKVPRFRLSYKTIDSKTVNISFEMASPQSPDDFKMYLSGKAFKVK